MIDTFCRAYEKWDASNQFLFAGSICCLLTVLLVLGALWATGLWRVLWEYLAVRKHGWPEGWADTRSAVVPIHRCDNPDNLTHRCLRDDGTACRTKGECANQVAVVSECYAGNTPNHRPALKLVLPLEEVVPKKASCSHPLNTGGGCMNPGKECQSNLECDRAIEEWRKQV